MADRKRVAILGGGMSSLVTAFELTSLPDWKDRYEAVTVYQQGWRLGGKGASGRNLAKGGRIEEHGLHLLFGCYENAFRILRQCYEELPRTWPWNFDDAFKGNPDATVITLYERDASSGDWLPWPVRVPTREGEPGVGEPLPWGVTNTLRLMMAWARAAARAWQQEVDIGFATNNDAFAGFAAVPFDLLDQAEDLLAPFLGGVLAEVVDVVDDVQRTVGDSFDVFSSVQNLWQSARGALDEVLYVVMGIDNRLPGGGSLAPLGDAAAAAAELSFGGFLARIDDFLRWSRGHAGPVDQIRRARIVIDFALTVSKGLVLDRAVLPEDNWFAVDSFDLRDWLERHGAEKETRESALVQGLYDAIFSWNAPVGAGSILHALIRASHYKGSLIYRMQAGMGDTIFAPLFEVLRRRGVKFEFFHRVENLRLSADRSRVEQVVIDRQVRLKAATYKPLVKVNGLPCWPSQPLLDQINDAQAAALAGHDLEDWWDEWRGTRRVLEADHDFDVLVLGIGIGAFPDICRDLIDDPQRPAFGQMVASVATTQIQAIQLWMNKSSTEIGWPDDQTIVIPYTDPLDTWADMSHLLPREKLPATVKSIAYLCSSMDDLEPAPPRHDRAYPGAQKQRVLELARGWLETSAATLWPKAAQGAAFDWNVLHTWSGATGEARLAEQHYCAPVNPSDRYVRVVPGSNAARLRADESGYANLYLTGDWTKTAMSIGCLEGATMAGIQTARAVDPNVPKAVYDWLPDTPPQSQQTVARTALRAAAPNGRRPYVVRREDLLVVPPVGLVVKMNTFILPAGQEALERICANDLNLGPGINYRPAGPFVVLYCADMDHVVTEGQIGGQEVGVWLPVVVDDGNDNASRLMTYSPMLWVNSSPALIGGRAVYGFPKHMATLTMPRNAGDPAEFGVDTFVMRLQGGVAEEHRLITMRRTDIPTWEQPGSKWDAKQLLAVIQLMLKTATEVGSPSWELVKQLFEPGGGMPMVFLKQFPQLDGTWDACYQAIVEAPVEIVGGREGGPVQGSYDIELLRCWSHEIVRRFDLQVDSSRQDANGRTYDVVKALATGWMAFKSQVKPGRVVWQG